MKNTKTKMLCEAAIFIAMAEILSLIKLYEFPNGGSITLEMIPLVLMGLRNGTKWGCFTGFVHGVLQMMMGFENVLYCATLPAQIGCILLHYILSQKKQRDELPENAAAVTTIVSTDMARAIAESYGCKMIEVLTGFKYIAEQIHLFETTGCNTFMFGFEESFGYLSGTDVRDKDGVNACMLIAEAASWYKKMYNKTLVDAIDMLYEQYGYYGDKVTSFVLPGKDGLEKMQDVMKALRENPPKTFAGAKVLALRDYQTGLRTTADGAVEMLTLPKSNVLYFELEDRAWVCVRPSGTEPKIKLYVNAVSDSADKTQALLNAYSDAAVETLNSRM